VEVVHEEEIKPLKREIRKNFLQEEIKPSHTSCAQSLVPGVLAVPTFCISKLLFNLRQIASGRKQP